MSLYKYYRHVWWHAVGLVLQEAVQEVDRGKKTNILFKNLFYELLIKLIYASGRLTGAD